MLELILGILLAAGATYFVLRPILRPPLESAGSEPAGDEGEDPADEEIEFDRATGKLSDSDYEQLKAKYTQEALTAMRGEPRLTPGASPGITKASPTASCPEHGARPEPDAVFCSECGKRLGSAPGYCARCGSALEDDARYCNRCGARVAA